MTAQTSEEKILLKVKGTAVAVMGLGSATALLAALFPMSFAAFAMGGIMSGILLAAGLVYLFATMFLNTLKQDSVGLWLRKGCWSRSDKNLYPETPAGTAEERNRMTEIMLTPKILVKQTFETRMEWTGRLDYQPRERQTGAWIQILFPSDLRGHPISFRVISSERAWPMMEVRKTEQSIMGPFVERGFFESSASFGTVTNRTPGNDQPVRFPPIPPEGEDVVWRTWVPLPEAADYIELQIWYPKHVISSDTQDMGYLYQIELSSQGETSVEGLLATELEVKSSREKTGTLEIPHDISICKQ